MAFSIIDPQQFVGEGLLREDDFVSRLAAYDWSRHLGQKVLVRGCGSTLIPPWAFMMITGRLVGVAESVRYGNEHDNIVVFRART